MEEEPDREPQAHRVPRDLARRGDLVGESRESVQIDRKGEVHGRREGRDDGDEDPAEPARCRALPAPLRDEGEVHERVQNEEQDPRGRGEPLDRQREEEQEPDPAARELRDDGGVGPLPNPSERLREASVPRHREDGPRGGPQV